MRVTPDQILLQRVRRHAELTVREIVTGREFISALFDSFANIERVYPELVPDLWAAIPDNIRNEFVEAICGAARPEFGYQPFYIGGLPLFNDAATQMDAELHTSRIQSWAREVLSFLASSGDLYRRQMRISKRSAELHDIMQSPYGMEKLMTIWREHYGIPDGQLPPRGVTPMCEILRKEFPGGSLRQ
ncbi:MAG: hypothetical protein JWP89_3095 [Schlesneria sp.]|nr:hypothetical protein [Schlesneria sp.]